MSAVSGLHMCTTRKFGACLSVIALVYVGSGTLKEPQVAKNLQGSTDLESLRICSNLLDR